MQATRKIQATFVWLNCIGSSFRISDCFNMKLQSTVLMLLRILCMHHTTNHFPLPSMESLIDPLLVRSRLCNAALRAVIAIYHSIWLFILGVVRGGRTPMPRKGTENVENPRPSFFNFDSRTFRRKMEMIR